MLVCIPLNVSVTKYIAPYISIPSKYMLNFRIVVSNFGSMLWVQLLNWKVKLSNDIDKSYTVNNTGMFKDICPFWQIEIW